jgi:hypothetical protein
VGDRTHPVASSGPDLPSDSWSPVTVLVFGVCFFVTNALFWVCGFLAYFRNFGGFARLAGALYVPILALPFVGRGELAGHDIRSIGWFAWFLLEVALAFGLALIRMPRETLVEEPPWSRRPPGTRLAAGSATRRAAAS